MKIGFLKFLTTYFIFLVFFGVLKIATLASGYIFAKEVSILSMFESVNSDIGIREIHLDGVGLLNQQVGVKAIVQEIGQLGSYITVSEGNVKLLVKTSNLFWIQKNADIKVGSTVFISGTVQSNSKGFIYLAARYILPS